MDDWMQEIMDKSEARRKRQEEEDKHKIEMSEMMKHGTPVVTSAASGGLFGPPPPASKSPEVFDRFAPTYGNIVKVVKLSGQSKTSATEHGLSGKTLAARLRDVRAAVSELGYKHKDVPEDSVAVMSNMVFRELGEWVFCEPRKRKLTSVTVPVGGANVRPVMVTTLADVEAVFTFVNLKDEGGNFITSNIVLAVSDDKLLVPDIARLFAMGWRIDITMTWVELSRVTVAG